jgi:H+/gluconate symporter-like permease
VGLLGILAGLAVLMALAFRGWTILLLAPLAAMIAAAFSGEPLLAHWTQTFMGAAAGFVAQFFPLFLLGALFGKLMDDSGSVGAIADFMTERLGPSRAILAVVLAGALITYGGVSLFVAFFVLAPMAWRCSARAACPGGCCPARWRSAPPPSPCRRCPGRPRSRTPSPCRSSARRPSRPPASGSSPRW